MTGITGALTKIAVPTAEGLNFASEGPWAEEVRRDHYRLVNVCLFTDRVSHGDVVRCVTEGFDRPLAMEVVERSPAFTLLFVPDDRDVDMIRALSEQLQQSAVGAGLFMESMQWQLAVAAQREDLDPVFAELRKFVMSWTGGPIETTDDHVGPMGFWQLSGPEDPLPHQLRWQEKDLEDFRIPEPVEVTWVGDDAVARLWPAARVEQLRAQAATDARLRTYLEGGLYLLMHQLQLRFLLPTQFGHERVGPLRWPLSPDAVNDPSARERWEAARDEDGEVRYADDDEVNAEARRLLTEAGLNPDDDPYRPQV